ncbi:MAG: Na+ dependent nucleoside transporter domain protein [Verrucomicrobia bacterium]|nr:Na+ dependent nucleoside transporter domain protein [Verrucomicrobiota bacterium]
MDIPDWRLRFTSLLGMVLLLALAWGLSNNRRRVPWRTVSWGLGLQFAFAVFILKTPVGAGLFDFANRAVLRLNDFANEGAKLVFGPLGDPALLAQRFGAGNAFIFAVTISASVIVVSALSSLFYHWRILPWVVQAMAWVMRRCMGTSGSETLAAATNIFLGQTESALVIKAYLEGMTRSEVMALMTIGMSTIASGVMVVYALMGASSGHLLTASVMSAPAALLIAKVMFPETQASQTAAGAPVRLERTFTNSIDALCRGAGEGVTLAINILGMLIAFVAVVALANHSIAWLLRKLFALHLETPLQAVLGWANTPFAWLMGIPARDCPLVGRILGERIVLNEFFGYLTLTQQKAMLNARSFTLATYALCGFANFGSIAVQIGGIGALAPGRRNDLAQLGLRSMIGGLLACYLTATIAGLLI